MSIISDGLASNICVGLLEDTLKISKADNSLKYFRKDFASRAVWFLILKAHFEKKDITIEILARAVAEVSTISKPTLRQIVDNAMHKGFIKLVDSKKDHRSMNIVLEEVTITEFKEWCSFIRDMCK
jgi:hypothetical protein